VNTNIDGAPSCNGVGTKISNIEINANVLRLTLTPDEKPRKGREAK
jgi:hypothetical protein